MADVLARHDENGYAMPPGASLSCSR